MRDCIRGRGVRRLRTPAKRWSFLTSRGHAPLLGTEGRAGLDCVCGLSPPEPVGEPIPSEVFGVRAL